MVKSLTPIQLWQTRMDIPILVKRDDMCSVAEVRGGKVRTCYALAEKAKASGFIGLTTAGSRSSPQVNIVANVAKELGILSTAHLPMGKLNKEIELAIDAGCEIIQHKAGYNSVIVARSRQYGLENSYFDIPFGMECEEAVNQTRKQVANLTWTCVNAFKRIIMPVGSGMSLAGVLHGLKDCEINIPVLGIVVGADPRKRLQKYAPAGWENMVTLQDAGVNYDEYINASLLEYQEPFTQAGEELKLDPVYEAKCYKFLREGDIFWIVGVRQSIFKK